MFSEIISELKMPARVLHAYQIYSMTHSVTKTAKLVGVNRSTIYRWKRLYEWDKLQEVSLNAIMDESMDNRERIRQMQLEIIRELRRRAMERDELEVRNIKELLALFRYQLELEGENFENSHANPNNDFNLELLHKEIEERKALVKKKMEEYQ